MGDRVFNGLAHWIKGGLFLIYGIFTLTRWAGCFSTLGWAWTPSPQQRISEEAMTSALLTLYGSINLFLEHLAGWGGSWTHSDLQHVSIAFLFLGGGVLGLLIESRRIRGLLHPTHEAGGMSFNPTPALVVFLLGILMSQHHQASHLSTVIHTQWGLLLVGAAVFRVLTYMLFYPRHPRGAPRPPTELVVAFGMIAGGLVFMMSNKDTVAYLERVGVGAMFSLTVMAGFSMVVMAWTVGVIAVGAWAGRRLCPRQRACSGRACWRLRHRRSACCRHR